MNFSKLPTNELSAAAYAEAEIFSLPTDWREKRELREGYAIDESGSQDIDDAISLTDSLLRVHIADLGAFISPDSAVSSYAQRNGSSVYKDHRATIPMIPRAISEDKLSLLDGVTRPVLTIHIPINSEGVCGPPDITRDAILTTRLSYAHVENKVQSDNNDVATVALRSLKSVATTLFAARHGCTSDTIEAVLEDENGNNVSSQYYSAGQLIVQEAMIAANSVTSFFTKSNDIPALYRNHLVPEDLMPETSNVFERSQLLGMIARASYSIEPQGHAGLNLPSYMHITSPIRRFADFATHANIAAFLENRDYPYPEWRLKKIAERLEMLALKPANEQRSTRNGITEKFAPGRQANNLLERFKNGTAEGVELTTALFSSIGTAEEKQAAKLAAAEYAAKNIHHARQALQIAIDRKHLLLRPAEQGEAAPHIKFVLDDQNGNIYPYATDRTPVTIAVASARLISTICGTDFEPVIPYNKTREGRLLNKGFYYLGRLSDERRLKLSHKVYPTNDGKVQAIVTTIVRGQEHTITATGDTKRQALQRASEQIITALDLITHPPHVLSNETTNTINPVSRLNTRQSKLGLNPTEYTISDSASGAKFECLAKTTDVDGTIYQENGIGKSKKEAKQNAAALLLARLPKHKQEKRGSSINSVTQI